MEPDDPARYLTEVNIEDAAGIIGCGPAFVRLAIDCGCPISGGMIAPATVTNWVCENLDVFRQMAGLPALPSLDALGTEDQASARVGYLLKTVAEYQGSRSSNNFIKKAYAKWARRIEGQIRKESGL